MDPGSLLPGESGSRAAARVAAKVAAVLNGLTVAEAEAVTDAASRASGRHLRLREVRHGGAATCTYVYGRVTVFVGVDDRVRRAVAG